MNKKVPGNYLKNVLPDDDLLAQCIRCGMCLTSCPTYEITKLERSSPRGRIKLINAVAKNELPLTKIFEDEMNFCLDCQACETACPAGVKFGEMVEAGRELADNYKSKFSFKRNIKKVILKYIVASRTNLKLLGKILLFYQKSGLQSLIRRSGIIKFFSFKLSEMELMLPEISVRFSSDTIKEKIIPKNGTKYKVAFLTGCLMDAMFSDINNDTVEVLSLLNCEIYTPKDQVCCGSLHAHNGDKETAIKLARKNLDIFSQIHFDFLISNSAGCGAFMKQYAALFIDDDAYREKAEIFSNKIKDITEFLSEINFDGLLNKIEKTISYHDACHLVHAQKIFNEPRTVIKKIPGLKFIEMPESTWCCGSAGIYNIVRYEDSMKILDRKIQNIISTGAEIIVAGNPGCISQIKYGIKKINKKIDVLHPATLIKHALIGDDRKHTN